MIELAYIARPLVGAVIGYITFAIAVRMLFRPRTAKYLFGMKIPFTPGLIPRTKSRIASSIGAVINNNLVNSGILEKTLLSEEITYGIRRCIQNFISTQKRNDESVEAFLRHYLSRMEIKRIQATARADLSNLIYTALSSAQFGTKIAKIVVAHAIERVRNGISGHFGIMGRGGVDRFLDMVVEPLEKLLSKNINEMIANHSKKMVGTIIYDQIDRFKELPVSTLFKGKDEQLEQAQHTLISLYRTAVSEQLPRILESFNISKIIEARINEMDIRETEKFIHEFMNKELNAIVWLGALSGFLIGCVNLLF